MRTLENHFYRSEIKMFPIKDKLPYEFKFKIGENEYTVVTKKSSAYPDRRVGRLRISTFGVKHYYGEFTANTSNVDVQNNNTSVSGYLGGVEIPSELKPIEFSILRPLTEEDFEEDPERFYGDRVGLTNGFYSQKEIIETFKELSTQILEGKWVIEIESHGGRLDEVFLIN